MRFLAASLAFFSSSFDFLSLSLISEQHDVENEVEAEYKFTANHICKTYSASSFSRCTLFFDIDISVHTLYKFAIYSQRSGTYSAAALQIISKQVV
jgi:hypothetical protein